MMTSVTTEPLYMQDSFPCLLISLLFVASLRGVGVRTFIVPPKVCHKQPTSVGSVSHPTTVQRAPLIV